MLSHDPITARMAGFMQHLRLNGFRAGPAETATALAVLRQGDITDRDTVRLSLKTLLTGRHEEWSRFDDLFEAYWITRGRVRPAPVKQMIRREDARPALWDGHLPEVRGRAGEADGVPEMNRLAASRQDSLARTDLRHLADPEEIAAAEALALRLARAMTYRLTRRYRLDIAGARIDLRRTIRHSIAHGGEPIEIARRDKPDRPVEILLILDVSGSMKPYLRFYLQFMKGLVSQWKRSDAYLLHTRLVRITDALRDRDPLHAMTRLSLMAEGFGGGTKLGHCLKIFNDNHARRALTSRSIVFIVSDGYDTGTPAELVRELSRLRKRARKLVWLNPMLGWRDYAPVTAAMKAALPFIDRFAAAHTLEALAAIESDLSRL